MAHIVRELKWGVLDLDTDRGQIFFQQRWQYSWMLDGTAAAWKYAEKRDFHHTLDRQVWGHWSMRFKFPPKGDTPFVRQFAKGVPINLDVKWALKDGHFQVDVTKYPRPIDRSKPTWVDFDNRKIVLCAWDTTSYTPKNAADKRATKPFYALPHEFGHAVASENDDEYASGNANLADTESIMNVGRTVRTRHLEGIRTELNKMLKGVTFGEATK